MNEGAAVFGQFAAEQFHDVRPRRDGITRAETDASGDQAVADGFIAVHHDLMAVFLFGIDEFESFQNATER
ncbi:MAG TPA: hypothetical protein VLB84_09940, partial [Bacteroidia bacterium]|nr:hypothetical protein [Bacteroidia bacterium]